jgi:capsule polysaccharide modification protein KpsS
MPVQDVSPQVDLERDPFGYVLQNNAPGPVQAAFPHLFVHRVPTPNQAGAENLRRLASRYLHHPEAQVGMVSMEAGTAGRFKVVITLELNDIF